MNTQSPTPSLFRLTSHDGFEVDITNIGARIMRLVVAGTDVVQGFDNPTDYLPHNHLSDFGAVIGRYANRIKDGRFVVDGHVVQLPCNNGPNCLHGGPLGWQYSLFQVVEHTDRRLSLSLTSPDGDNGFPGEVQVRVTYTIDAPFSLRIDYHASTDRPTVINMTNHSYFNLDGVLPQNRICSSVLLHHLSVSASYFSPTDSTAIPLANHLPVASSPFDFRIPKPIGRDIATNHPQLLIGRGYDHNFLLDHPSLDRPSATLYSPLSGITLSLFTTAPGLQLYTGNFLDGIVGKGGVSYPLRSAVCLEAQQYPDSPNRHWPESTGRLLPDNPFHSTTIFRFSLSHD